MNPVTLSEPMKGGLGDDPRTGDIKSWKNYIILILHIRKMARAVIKFCLTMEKRHL